MAKGYSPEQIVRKLREAESKLVGGAKVPEVARDLGISEATFHRWRKQYGGMSPGSVPVGSREVYQEGIIIPPVKLVSGSSGGEYVPDVLDLLLANVRTPEIRRGDLRAQVAANNLAQTRVSELIERRGRETVLSAFDEVISYTERRTREAIRTLPDGSYSAESEIEGNGVTDEDISLRVAVEISGDGLRVDFSGTSEAVAGNVNCPLAVTRSACYFALRVLLPGDIPANAGTYAPLTSQAPEGILVNASNPSAVVAGNVETSQRIADTLLAALCKVPGLEETLIAGGQGTMNNLIIGGRGWTYYETIGGGQGASARGPGPSGVHVGMSNTLNTPVEALELEYHQTAYKTFKVKRIFMTRGRPSTSEAVDAVDTWHYFPNLALLP